MPMFQARIIRQEVAITDMEGDTLEAWRSSPSVPARIHNWRWKGLSHNESAGSRLPPGADFRLNAAKRVFHGPVTQGERGAGGDLAVIRLRPGFGGAK